MFVTTKGIVLHKIKYSDTSLIVKIFTEKFGTQSFIVKNAFAKKTKINHTFFTSLALLEVTFDDHQLHKLSFLKDVSFISHFKVIPFDPLRNSILFFYNELFYKLLFSSMQDEMMYEILENGILELDDPNDFKPDQHLHLLSRVIHCLGISPENDYSSIKPYFCLEENRFGDLYLENKLFLSASASSYFSEILSLKVIQTPSKIIRNEVLYGMVNYLIMNNEHIKSIDSLPILIDLMK